jgi:conjugal transfer pilus assembly protein TraL
MSHPSLYTVVNHLDSPKRYLTLTIDEASVAMMTLMLFVLSTHKIVVLGLGFFLYALLKGLKRGNGPRFLLVLAYRHLPSPMTGWFLRALPASHFRIWRA